MEEVLKVHYDYSNITGVERSFARRLIPFYGWMKQNTPAVLRELTEKPGGKMRQSVRVAANAKGENPGFVPGYIGSGVGMKVGEPEEGTSRFLSRLGLPFEDLGELLSGGGPLGGLNPLLKVPIEQATGTQMHSGRDIRDLYSMSAALTGEPHQTIENAVVNSPLGAPLTTGRTILDPRKDIGTKALNLLTGFRLTDVDMEKARNSETRRLVEERLRGQPGVGSFERLYVRPENLENLSQAELDLLRLYRSREQASRRANQQRIPS
jgi:hypothetical protein